MHPTDHPSNVRELVAYLARHPRVRMTVPTSVASSPGRRPGPLTMRLTFAEWTPPRIRWDGPEGELRTLQIAGVWGVSCRVPCEVGLRFGPDGFTATYDDMVFVYTYEGNNDACEGV